MSFDRIGLGTTTPQADFHLVGNSIVQGNVTIGLNSIAVNPLRVASDGNVPTIYATHDGTNGIYSAMFEGTTSIAQGVHIKTIANNDSINALLVEGTSSNVVVKSSGKVGLGTDTPSEVLHVVGNAKITGAVSVGSIDISTIATSNLSSASVSATNITATTASLGTVYASAISIPSFSVSNISASVVSSGTVHVGSTRLSSDKTSYTLLGTDTADEVLNTKIVMYGSDFAGVGGTIKLIATEGQGGDISFNYQPSTGAMVTNMVIGSDGRTGIGTNVVASGVRLAIQGNVVVSGATTISGATLLRDTLSVGGAITGSSLSLSSNMTTTNISSAVISSANAFVGNLTLTNGVAGTISINTAIINTASIGTLTFNNVSVSGQVSASSIVVSSLSANTGVVITEYISTAYIRTTNISNAVIVGIISSGNLIATASTISNGQVVGKLSVGGAVNLGGNYYDGSATIGYSGSNAFVRVLSNGLALTKLSPDYSLEITHNSSNATVNHNMNGQLFLNTSGGNVGIGTTNAINKLYVNGGATINGLLSASGIEVNGIISATAFVGNLQTTGAIINGTLSVVGVVSTGSTLFVAGNMITNNNLSVAGALSVGGATRIVGIVSTGSTLFVAGNMITNNNLSVAGALSVAGSVNMSSNVVVMGSPEILDTRVCAVRTGYGAGLSWSATTSQPSSRGWRIANDDVGPWGSFTIASSTTNSTAPSTVRLVITKDGYVGIGTDTSSYPLQVYSSVNTSLGYANSYVFNNVTGGNPFAVWLGPSNYTTVYSIVADAYIFSRIGFSTLSDKRIKKDISIIDDGEALSTLRKIEPKKYKYLDKTRGEREVYGFIAQDVQKEFPEATQVVTGEIPDIYKECVFELPNKLYIQNAIENEKISLRLANGSSKEVVVSKVENDYVIISENLSSNDIYNNKVFVYGRVVNDLVNIKKDYLWAINFAATQELDRKVAKLEQENTDLKQKLNAIMAKLNLQ